MIPIKEMQFVVADHGEGFVKDKLVRGKIVFSGEMRVSGHLLQHEQHDMIEAAKDRIKDMVWDKTYRELIDPIRRLQMHALHNATTEQHEVRELVDKINALLDWQNTEGSERRGE